MNFRAILGSVLLFLSVLGLGAALAYSKYAAIQAQMSAPPRPESPEAVIVAEVKSVKTRAAMSSMGTLVATRWITLKNEIAGSISKFAVKSGQIVEQGDVLLELDASVELAQLQYAQARQRIAQSTFKRTQRAGASKALTELEVEQAEAELEQAKAEVARQQATLAKKTLRAPFRARVGLINVHEGQYINEGTEITTLQGVDNRIYVDFMIPQHVASQVAVGQAVKLRLPSGPLSAGIVAVDSQADRPTRNLMVRAELADPPDYLVPNESLAVELEYGPETTLMAVPLASIRRAPSGAFVFLAEPDKEGELRARLHSVTTGRSHEQLATILGELPADAQVVTEGSFKLRDGALLAVQQPEPPAKDEGQVKQ